MRMIMCSTVIINSPIANEDCIISDIVNVSASDPSGISYVIANVNGQNYTMTLQNGLYVLPFSQIAGDLDPSYYFLWFIPIRVPNVITIYATDSVGNVNSSQSVTLLIGNQKKKIIVSMLFLNIFPYCHRYA
jgi:hypothetical protein